MQTCVSIDAIKSFWIMCLKSEFFSMQILNEDQRVVTVRDMDFVSNQEMEILFTETSAGYYIFSD